MNVKHSHKGSIKIQVICFGLYCELSGSYSIYPWTLRSEICLGEDVLHSGNRHSDSKTCTRFLLEINTNPSIKVIYIAIVITTGYLSAINLYTINLTSARKPNILELLRGNDIGIKAV